MSKKRRSRDATLEELEGKNWGEPLQSSHLVTECYRLRRVQLRELTVENLRIMIGQDIGLPFLMPLAVNRLRGRTRWRRVRTFLVISYAQCCELVQSSGPAKQQYVVRLKVWRSRRWSWWIPKRGQLFALSVKPSLSS